MLRRITLLLFLTALRPACSFSQTIFSITGGSNFYIPSAQVVSLDSLVLTPSANYNITGSTVLTHNTSLTHSSSNLSINRAYSLSGTLSAYSGSIAVYYLSSELNTLSPSTLQVNAYSTHWTNYTSTNGTNMTTASGLSNISFNEVSLASSAAALPLSWLSASARRQGNTVEITWWTANEMNCKNYQVQKSGNGTDWVDAVGAIAAMNSAGPNKYVLADSFATTALCYYRIAESDIDDRYNYSGIMVVQAINGNENILITYPNPVTDVLTIATGNSGAELKTIRISDAQGQIVFIANVAATRQYRAAIGQLATGLYTVLVSYSDGSTASRGFIKQ
ncbi:MAG TPA: T9SS type A sorting domain-containing protein [Chitinophagaceae bacterium]